MSNKRVIATSLVAVGLSLAIMGCTTGRSVHHFSPSPAARVRSQELGPAKPQLVSELLRSAQQEFEAANGAQEEGDHEAAIQHYAKMLDLLRQANLDPSAFYNLRAEFERIIHTAAPDGAHAAQESQPAALPPESETAGQQPNAVEEAFEAANAAQEKGDREAALRNYTRMLELLAQNHLDPAGLYNLRSELERVLDSSEKQARLYDRQRANQWKWNEARTAARDIDIEYPLSDRVLAEIQEIQNVYPRNFQGGLDRSCKYLPYVQGQFAQAGLPQDLVWLAMVESQFSPKVVSRAGAGGMWQFMRDTGNRYGLKVDRYVDDRFNWKQSTQAAVQYLSELYDHFDGSWPLAVSAYNMGEGGLDRAIASNGGERNLWKLIETPPASESIQQETKKFYPKLLASIIVAKDPERFGFTFNPQDPEQTARAPIRGSYSLAALDRALNLPEGTLRQYNPDLIRGVTPPSGEFSLAVPSETGMQLASVIKDVPQIRPEILRGWDKKRTHVVRRGETPEVIAKKYGIAAGDLLRANQLKPDTRLTSGRKLTIPGGSFDPDNVDQQTASANEQDAKGGNKPAKTAEAKRDPKSVMHTYTVKPGDTLTDIAKREKVSLKDLLAMNKIKDGSKINVGDKLRFTPLADLQADSEEETEKTHVVQSGDSPAKIAKLYGVNLDDLLQWNKLSKVSTVHVGDKLIVRGVQEERQTEESKTGASGKTNGASAGAASTNDLKKVEHKVAKGETASTIAAKYGVKVSDFLAWNKLTPKSVIREGAVQMVYIKDDKAKPADNGKAAPASKGTEIAKAKPAAKTATPSKPDPKPVPKGTEVAEAAPADKNVKQWKSASKTAAKTDASPAKSQDPKPDATIHVVSKGENPSTIASRYKVKLSDLYKWNNWGKNVVLQPGQKVTIIDK
jgi:membrane-bound lytic murein transglycosylase D